MPLCISHTTVGCTSSTLKSSSNWFAHVAHVPGNGTKSGGGNERSFNGRFREDWLNVNWFWNVMDARWKIAAWRKQYQEERPHSSLGYRAPAEFAHQMGGENGCGKVKATFPLRLEIPRRA
jgi:hypothetical protein